jgi:outer membrane lipoprotein LolB
LTLRAAAGAFCFALFFIAGCAQQPLSKPVVGQEVPFWHGRLALRFDNPEKPSFFANFELTGHDQTGELNLFGPLGNTVASLRWTPHAAILQSGSEIRQFESLDALAAEATGAAIPITALFQWLHGQNTVVAGWQADLSQLAQGRLSARRVQPEPAAELRIILEP